MAEENRFPAHWGDPPGMQTADVVELPGGWGTGSSSLAAWIRSKMAMDKAKGRRFYPKEWGAPPVLQTRDYVKLPAGYGHGSSVLRSWIESKLK